MKSLLKLFTVISVFGLTLQTYAADYAVILKTLSNPFWVAMQDGIKEEAKRLNVEVDIFAVASEGDIQAQMQLFEDLNNKGYKGIAFAPLSPVSLVQPAAAAYKKGTILVNLDEKVDVASLKAAGGNVNAFITTDNIKVGETGASYIVEKLGSTGGKVAIIEGKAGNVSGENRKQGAENAFSAAANVELIASQPADWDRIRALDVATNILQRNKDIKGIYCANDTMALGAQQAVENAGKAKEIIVVGTDGMPEAVEMVKSGKMGATVAQDPAKVGARGLEIMVKAVEESNQISLDDEPQYVAVDSVLITK